LRQECRISGTGPTTVVSQTGEYKKVVDWIDAAYQDIQNIHANWRFLQSTFSFTMTIGTRDYTPAEAGISDLSKWKFEEYGDIRCYLIASDEQRLEYMTWDDFRDHYLIGTSRTTSGRPSVFTIEPDDTIDFDVLPDAAYTCVGEYFKTPDVLSGDTDIPLFPSQYHLAIVYRAMMFYGADYAADEKYTHGYNEYRKIMRTLEHNQLHHFNWGAPLA
jgi:hypothetical protein